MSRPSAAPVALLALVALVLGVLVCGTVSGGGSTGTGAGAGAAGSSLNPRAQLGALGHPGPVVVVGAGTPGCDQGHGAEQGAAAPAVPPRTHGLADLLSSLAADRAGCPGLGGDQDRPDARAGRAPPELVPPSPVELSILRV
ncbi:hypothetical protein [Streptomyces sp. NPDC090025]|uniref:hypothetical protein n=1 Tax=Streptomyces sp. NPDC090025 TaxID=3365922 RepID=UPI00383949A6